MGESPLGRLSGTIRAVLSPEKLDELPEVRESTLRPSFLGWLAAREELPEDGAPATEKEGFLSRLLRSEALALDPPEPASGRPSFLATLLSCEELPEEAASGQGARRNRGGRA